MPKIKPTKLIMAIVIAILMAVTAWYFLKPKEQQPQYITA